MKLKILGVNFPSEKFDCISFNNPQSFTDYDAVIIDPGGLLETWRRNALCYSDGTCWLHPGKDRGLSKQLKNLMERRKEEVKLFTGKNQGILVCFLRRVGEEINIDAYPKSRKISIYSWLPEIPYYERRTFSLGSFLKERKGKEVSKVFSSHPFAECFAHLRDEISFEAVLGEELFSGVGSVEKILKPIAQNKVGELISFEIAFGEGKIVFLPSGLLSADRNKMAGILMSCIKNALNMPQLDSPPSWIGNYSLPGEDELMRNLEALKEKEKELEKEKKELKKEDDRLNLLKALLYGKGKYVLEPAVREAFRILGFAVQDRETYEEKYDLLAIEGEILVIGEVEGSEHQIDVKKYRQLLDYFTNVTLQGKKCKGLLIGNGFLDQEPCARPPQFSEEVVRGCRSQNFCRITTFELYKAVKKVLSSHGDDKAKEKIKKAIIECTDEFLFDRLDI